MNVDCTQINLNEDGHLVSAISVENDTVDTDMINHIHLAATESDAKGDVRFLESIPRVDVALLSGDVWEGSFTWSNNASNKVKQLGEAMVLVDFAHAKSVGSAFALADDQGKENAVDNFWKRALKIGENLFFATMCIGFIAVLSSYYQLLVYSIIALMFIASMAITGLSKLKLKPEANAQKQIPTVDEIKPKRWSPTEARHEPVQDERLDFPAAIAWACTFGTDFSSAWHQCPKAHWLFYLADHFNPDRKDMILAANDCIFYVRGNPDIANVSEFPDAGEMFAWMVLNSNQFCTRSKQFNIVERWSRGEATVDDCREAEMQARETAASMHPGDCQNGWEADEVCLCSCMHESIMHLLRAIIVLETLGKEAAAQKECVYETFQKYSGQSGNEKMANMDTLFIFNLAMAVRYSSFIIHHDVESSKLPAIVRDRIVFS